MRKHLLPILFIPVVMFLFGCDRYNRSNDTIYDVPEGNNLFSDTGLKALLDEAKKNPADPEIFYKIALCYLSKEQDTLAIENVLKSIKLDSINAKYYPVLAEAYKNTKQIDEALKACQMAQNLKFKETNLLLLMSELYLIKKEYEDADKYLNMASELMPGDARIFYLKGSIALGVSDTATAIRNLNLAIQRRPSYAEAYNSLAELYIRYEDYSNALRYLNIGLKYSKDNDYLNFNKAEVFKRLTFVFASYTDSARIYYEKVFVLNPKMYKASFELGMMAFKKMQYKEAQRYLEHTLKFDEQMPEVHYYLGICYRYAEKDEMALLKFEKTMQLDPQNYAARDYYWNTKSKIELAKMVARNDSLQQVYLKDQADFEKQLMEEQKQMQLKYEQQQQIEQQKLKEQQEKLKKE